MLYLTYYNYKRNNYGKNSFILWTVMWVCLLFLISIPTTIYGLMQTLKIERTADFFVLAGFTIFSIIIFYQHISLKKLNKKIEIYVRTKAIKKLNEKMKK
ncbi:DUF2304 domain-containing protein [Candidatus Woesearchaeota archaeon]|nr:DUF2304 domain-containing protein [Candidatus Woesearchaeota archaeon]MCF8013489.1 DUF2304 domain-containing protein [Candidatus Woesearchaeota archaeon]